MTRQTSLFSRGDENPSYNFTNSEVRKVKLGSKNQTQAGREYNNQSELDEGVKELLTKVLSEMHDVESVTKDQGETLSETVSAFETSEDIVAASQAATRLLDLVLGEKRRRARANNLIGQKKKSELRNFVLSSIRENGKNGWKGISILTDAYEAEDIKKALRTLRRMGTIERVDGGGRGVSAVFDISLKGG